MEAMRTLKWSASHAVFFPEIDDEHKEIFAALSSLQRGLEDGTEVEIRQLTGKLIDSIAGHFAHEERLMRAARYTSLRWHKEQHDNARKRVGQYVARLNHTDADAGAGLVEYLTKWLNHHTRLADRMMASFLRNQRRGVCTVTFRSGTRPADACTWVDVNGEKFDPMAGSRN